MDSARHGPRAAASRNRWQHAAQVRIVFLQQQLSAIFFFSAAAALL
jgi:hypothetical protein